MALYKTKPKFKDRISHIVEYLLVLFLFGLVNMVPYRFLHSYSGFLMIPFWPILGGARERIYNNISWYWPNKSEKEKKKFVRKNLIYTIRVSLEVFQVWKFRDPKFMQKYMHIKNEQTLDIFTKRTSGIVGVEGHFGNWEIPILLYHLHGVEIAFSAKHMKNPFVDRMLENRRKKYGGKIIYLDQSGQFIRELVKKNVVGLVADQDAGRNGVFVNFLGKKASTFTGPATLAYTTGTPVVLATCVYLGKGHYEMELMPVLPPVNKNDYKSKDDAIEKITQAWSNALAEQIKKYPDQYFWIHRRWKTRPEDEQD